MLKPAGFEHWTPFESGDIASEPAVLDYIAAIVITYTVIHFLGDFLFRIGGKMV